MNHLLELIIILISIFILSKGSSFDYKDSIKELKLKTRYLQFADDDINLRPESQESAPEPQVNSTSLEGAWDSNIRLVGISSFNQESTTLLTWIMYFIIVNRNRPEVITFTVNIYYNQLRNLQTSETQEVTCTFSNNNQNFYAYKCTSPANGNVSKVSSNNDFKFDGETVSEVYTSFMSESSLQNIQNEKYNDFILIDNGKIIYAKVGTLSIKGNIVSINSINFDLDKIDEIPFIFNDISEGTNSPKEVNCKVINKDKDDYRLRCLPGLNFKSNIQLSCGEVNKSKICLNMKENDLVDFQGNSTLDTIPNKKNSGGLSGGAIAGIIIPCCALLIASAIIAFACKKIPSETAKFQNSKTYYESTDNIRQSQ